MISARLARRDFSGGLGGLGLLFACLFLSLAGLAAVLSLTASMEKAIDDNGRALLAGDLKFEQTQRAATEAELATLAEAGTVSRSIATRAMLRGESDVALVDLRGVDDAFPLAGAIDLAEGRRPENAQEIAVDATLARDQGLAVGDSVSLGIADYEVVGLLNRLPGGTFVFAPPALVTRDGLLATGLVQPGSLVDYEVRVLLDDDSDLAGSEDRLREALEPIGWESDNREEAAGGTQRFVAATGDMLLFIAIAALGIGALGIGSAMRAFATSRRPTVARLKLLGATSTPLQGMFALQVFAIVVAAMVPGLALGATAPLIVGQIVGDQLPILPDPGPHWGALGLAAGVGALVTLAASWRPLQAALRTSPKAMLRAGELEGGLERRKRDLLMPIAAALGALALLLAGSGEPRLAAIAVGVLVVLAAFFALLGWLVQWSARRFERVGNPIARLGIAALNRPGNATRRLVVSLGLGLSILVALAAGSQSLLGELNGSIPQRAPSHVTIDVPKDGVETIRAVAEDFAPGGELRTVPAIRGAVSAVDGIAVADLPEERQSWLTRGDRGLTFSATIPEGNRVTAGEWWSEDHDGPALVSLEADAAADLQLDVGDSITFNILGREIEAEVAALREVDWETLGFNFGIVFSPNALEDAPFTWLASLAPAEDAPVRQGYTAAVSDALPATTTIAVSDVLAEVRSILAGLDAAIRIATLLAIGIGVVVLAGSVVATRAARARDISLLRLVGATKRQLVMSQLIEFAILSVAAVALAMGTGLAMAWLPITQVFEIPFRPEPVSLLLLAFGAIVVAIGAAMLAVRPALRRSPTRMLRAR